MILSVPGKSESLGPELTIDQIPINLGYLMI